MVRVNLLSPRRLADQHLVAEYNELLMLSAYVRKHPAIDNVPPSFRLGRGHMRFFKDKLRYLLLRHQALKAEMRRRGFRARKTLRFRGVPRASFRGWKPSAKDKSVIRRRLTQKLRAKPGFYRYRGRHKPLKFFLQLIRRG